MFLEAAVAVTMILAAHILQASYFLAVRKPLWARQISVGLTNGFTR